MTRFILAVVLTLSLLNLRAQQKKEITILSVNDMHAVLEHMPKFAFIADSLRNIYPDLLILSAGDNRTGDPVNDIYPTPGLPMITLMNLIGFDASALGNHEYDTMLPELSKMIGHAHFPFLAANMLPPSPIKNHLPYTKLLVGNTRIGIIGLTQRNELGIPDAHPDRVKGIQFLEYDKGLQPYLQTIRNEVDILILLTHIGYTADKQLAATYADKIDLIVGGHSHSLVPGELHNGVMITQADNKLKYATLSHLELQDNKIVSKRAENINVRNASQEDSVALSLVKYFKESNHMLFKKLVTLTKPLTNKAAVGYAVTDIHRKQLDVQAIIANQGGIRVPEIPAGDILVRDILSIDPFGNEMVKVELTVKEFEALIHETILRDEHRLPYLSGYQYRIRLDKNGLPHSIQLLELNGKKPSQKQKIRLAMNSWLSSVCVETLKDKKLMPTGLVGSDVLIEYLSNKGGDISHDYDKVNRIIIE